VKCPASLCEKELKYIDMLDHLSKECPHIIISCPNQCGIKDKREQLIEHLKGCDSSLLPSYEIKDYDDE
jgi:hypothetical protein